VFGATDKLTVVEAPLPAEFCGVIVNVVEAKVTVGMPLISQVDWLIESPVGRAGEMEQVVMEAPLVSLVVGDTLMDTSH
jgi:hypothetical protein